MLEIPEIWYQKFDYLNEAYNLFDISQLFLFAVHLIFRIKFGKIIDF